MLRITIGPSAFITEVSATFLNLHSQVTGVVYRNKPRFLLKLLSHQTLCNT
jgi:hypothetical protein